MPFVARAADYMPPPLFGEQMPVTKVTPDTIVPIAPAPAPVVVQTPEPVVVPIAPPPPAPVVTLPPLAPPIATAKPLPNTTNVIPPSQHMPQAAIRDDAPSFTIDDLLAHPAGSVDARAKAALSTQRAPGLPMGAVVTHRPAGPAKPILENDPSAPPPPKIAAPKIIPRPVAKPDVPLERAVVASPAPTPTERPTTPTTSKAEPPALMDYDMPDLSHETPVDVPTSDDKPGIPEDAVTIDPVTKDTDDDAPAATVALAPALPPSEPVVTKPKIKSPSPVVKRVITENPKVMVYSRDKETGEFKKVERADILVSPTPTPKSNASVPPPPPPITASVRQNDALSDRVVPLTAEQVSKGLLDEDLAGIVPSAPPPKDVGQASGPLATLDITFDGAAVDLSDNHRARIDQAVIKPLAKDTGKMVELHAYAASGPDGDSPDNRRVALARGLAVRDYLMSQNVAGGRINLKVVTGPDATANSNPTPANKVEFWVK